MSPPVQVAIIGSGMSGICMAVRLLEAGIDTFTVFEKADDVGGTWRDNRYPGLTCDVPAPYYSYTFAPNPDWTQLYASGRELHSYFSSVAQRYGVLDHVRYRTEIVDASFDGDRWQLRSAAGDVFTADVVVAATGILHRPRLPEIPGLGTFAGPVFHSSQWDGSTPVDGRRIGVIGTGSTGTQIVTALSRRAAKVVQFQRTPQWIMPLPNWTYTRVRRTLMRRAHWLNDLVYRGYTWAYRFPTAAMIRPGWQRKTLQGICRLNLRTVRDQQLRARLTPDTQPLCRRVVISSGYYRAIQRPTVHIVTETIDHVEPAGVVTTDGVRHELDVLALATGFDAQAYVRPMQVTGRDGCSLAETWAKGPRAHRTVGLPGFPNFFLLMGPNSPIAQTSLVPIAEAQAGFVLGWIKRIHSGELSHVEPDEAAAAAFNQSIQADMGGTVWTTGCDSWYLGPDGHPNLWPNHWTQFSAMLSEPDEDEYVLTRNRVRPGSTGSAATHAPA